MFVEYLPCARYWDTSENKTDLNLVVNETYSVQGHQSGRGQRPPEGWVASQQRKVTLEQRPKEVREGDLRAPGRQVFCAADTFSAKALGQHGLGLFQNQSGWKGE
jgi:hypothetical protein